LKNTLRERLICCWIGYGCLARLYTHAIFERKNDEWEKEKYPCRCKMLRLIQAEDLCEISQSNDVLTDVQAWAEKTVV